VKTLLENAMAMGSADADSEVPSTPIGNALNKFSNANDMISAMQLPFKKQVH